MPSKSGRLFNRLFSDKANIRIPNPTITQAIIAGPGDAALAKSLLNAKMPEPIEEVITNAINVIPFIG